MKIKVGDWVNVIINVEDGKVVHNRIAKCHNHRNGLVYYFNGDRIVYAIEENVEKLPIKFKGFEVLEGVEIIDTRYVKETGKTYHFSATPSKSSTLIRVFIRLFVDGNWAYVVNSCSKETITKAKDWLELQYATLLAKERSLI